MYFYIFSCILIIFFRSAYSQHPINDIRFLGIEIQGEYITVSKQYNKLVDILRRDLSAFLKMPPVDIYFGLPLQTVKPSFRIPIEFHTKDKPYINKFYTPETHDEYYLKLSEFVGAHTKVTLPADNEEAVQVFINQNVELTQNSYAIDENAYWTNETRKIDYSYNPILQAQVQEQSIYTFQLKLLEPMQNYEQSPEIYVNFIDKFSDTVASILNVASSSIVSTKFINDNSLATILQFVVDPNISPNENELAELWKTAIDKKDSRFRDLVSEIDYSLVPVITNKRVSTTTTTITTTFTTGGGSVVTAVSSSSSNSGVIAGSVCGAIAAVAILGGGGYFLVKKYKKPATDEVETDNETPDSESL